MDDSSGATGTGADRPTGMSGGFQELRRRHIFKVTAAYLVLAWLLMQVAAVLESSLKLPDWTDTFTFAILVIGFPIALFVTWAVDLTAKPLDASPRSVSPDHTTQHNETLFESSTSTTSSEVIHDKASIAVLPFENLSGDPDQDFIGEGIAADIITTLSRIRSFHVIARNSTFQYRKSSANIQSIARDLAARYVIEGDTRKINNRLRASALLVDSKTGHTLWSESYDKLFEDLFDIQSDVTMAIVAKLEPELNRAEFERTKTRKVEELNAWELYHRGMHQLSELSRQNLANAADLFQKSIEADTNFAPAHASLAYTLFNVAMMDETTSPVFDEALAPALKAVQLDPNDARSHYGLAWAYIGLRQLDRATAEAEKAIELNPSFALAFQTLAACYLNNGHAGEAIPLLEKAIDLNPRDPQIGRVFARMASANLYLKRYDKVLECGRRITGHSAGWPPIAAQISALGHLGKIDEARSFIQEFQAYTLNASVEYAAQHIPTVHKPDIDHLLDGLRKAGLPEHAPSES